MIDWVEIESRFRIALLFLDGFCIPGREDFERHEANLLTGGLVITRFVGTPSYFDTFLLPGGQDWLVRARQLQLEIQSERDVTIDNVRLPSVDWRMIISECINNRSINNGFILSWSIMEQLSGRLIELENLNKSAHGQYRREISSGSSTNLKAQKCWYALWLMKRDAIEVKSRRLEAQDELLGVCFNAHKGRLRCPLIPHFYDAAWFRRLLRRDGKKVDPKDQRQRDMELTGSLDRLSLAEIRALASDAFLVAEVLPPLQRSAFTEISTAP